MAIKIDIKNLPKTVKIIIAVLPALIFIGVYIYFAILPKHKQINGLKQEISKQENNITESQRKAEKLDELKAENQRLKERLTELGKQLPTEKEISPLLTLVSDLGTKSGLNIISWKPSRWTPHPSGIVFEVPVSVEITGSYHKLASFFSKLTLLDRIVNIINIRLGGPRVVGEEAILGVSFSAVTFTNATEGGAPK
ncbi:MAG: type 4a pilus biogenesis protein PilO [Nitrospirae bacterium]|nr:type 4a pilus biogenesis protein PilO [Nitrospirota bacterium]